jgi:hypothetical protein
MCPYKNAVISLRDIGPGGWMPGVYVNIYCHVLVTGHGVWIGNLIDLREISCGSYAIRCKPKLVISCIY